MDDLKLFTTYHIYAVWDFYVFPEKIAARTHVHSIALNPSPHPEVGRLINEIVWGEETDVNFEGRPHESFF